MTSYVLLDVTTGLIAASLPVLSALVTRIRHKYHDYRFPGRNGDDRQLEGKSSPRHLPIAVVIARLGSGSSSEMKVIKATSR